MAPEHVELVERVAVSWNEGDWDAVFAHWHDDVVFEDSLLPDGGTYTGKAAVADRMDEVRSLVGDWKIATESILDAGADVVWISHVTSQKDADAPPVDFIAGAVFSFDGNLVKQIRWFPSPEAALAAAGLEPL
jgi:hypothetical protein